jgi:hypothetical protein
MLNSENQQTAKMNKGERRQQTVFKSAREKIPTKLQELANISQQ